MDKGIKSYSNLLRDILKLKTYPVGLKICEWFISGYGVVFCIPCPRYEFYNYSSGRISKPEQASPSNSRGVPFPWQVTALGKSYILLFPPEKQKRVC